MNTVVCFKLVKDEQDFISLPDGSVDTSRAQLQIGEYDRNAIEACRVIAEVTGSTPVGLTFGGAASPKGIQAALSRGLDECYAVVDGLIAPIADSYVTANVLASAIGKIGDFNAVICAEGSADMYAHQIGPRVGKLLGIPVVTDVCSYEFFDNKAKLTRVIARQKQTIEVRLPVAISLLPEANPAPIPGLKAVLAAKKKKITNWSAQNLGLPEEKTVAKTRIVGSRAYTSDRQAVVFKDGDLDERVSAFVGAIKEAGVI